MDIQITEMRDGKVVFAHSETQYEIEYDVGEDAYPYLFNDDGSPKDNPCFALDTFKTAEIEDVDGDGVDELTFRQYVSIGWHANYIGDCESVWKIIDGELTLISLKLRTK